MDIMETIAQRVAMSIARLKYVKKTQGNAEIARMGTMEIIAAIFARLQNMEGIASENVKKNLENALNVNPATAEIHAKIIVLQIVIQLLDAKKIQEIALFAKQENTEIIAPWIALVKVHVRGLEVVVLNAKKENGGINARKTV